MVEQREHGRRDLGGLLVAMAQHTVEHGLLAAVSELPDDELEQALRDAVAHHVLVADAGKLELRKRGQNVGWPVEPEDTAMKSQLSSRPPRQSCASGWR